MKHFQEKLENVYFRPFWDGLDQILDHTRTYQIYGSTLIQSPCDALTFSEKLEKNNERFWRYFQKGPFSEYFGTILGQFCPILAKFNLTSSYETCYGILPSCKQI